jgi:hypothetical protein
MPIVGGAAIDTERVCSDGVEVRTHMTAARDHLAALLAGAASPEAFSASRSAPTSDLQIEVRGVGPIRLPVSRAQARQLCQVARPARYGHGELTILDRGVRDTWEIPKSRVKIDARRWNKTLRPALDRLGRDLGLPSGSELRAELHSMLVYARGQFFVQHQDSEKDDTMIASLVVGLPSSFKGGALELQHGGKTATYRGSKQALSLVAFYSDCRHQVKPVTSGHRIVLTYNLLLRRGVAGSATALDAKLVDDLAGCLDQHFAASESPDRLVYLLDHEYTRRGLDWTRLKGTDAQRVSLLAAAAKRAECDRTLALADIHETWSAYEPERGYRRWSHRDDWDDDSFDADGSDDYELEELIESEVRLESWIDRHGGRPVTVNLAIGDDELCASTPSGDLDPYSSEYEGYMGNWGNTLDRWYHRGAVVLWPRSRAFVVQAEATPAWALDELAARVRQGELASARKAAGSLVPLWGRVAARVESRSLLAKALRVAKVIDDPQLATMLLRPFRLQMLSATHAEALSTLVGLYGVEWAAELVALWSASLTRHHYVADQDTPAWMASLPRLCLALRDTGELGASAARRLVEAAWQWGAHAMDRDLQMSSPSQREQALRELGTPLAAILQGAAIVDASDVHAGAVERLCRDDSLLGCATGVLRATPRSQWAAVGVDALAAHCRAILGTRLARPERSRDDWSIDLPAGCECDLCAALRAFLMAPSRRTYEWPLAKDGRRHVHQRVDAAELPVQHQTRRAGRPYTLILTKTDALFERDGQQRRSDQDELTWLTR